MARKIDKEADFMNRFLQIRRDLFGGNNLKFAERICENDKIVSSICCGSRPAGLTTIQKIVDNIPEIDANWLMRGEGVMLKQQPVSPQSDTVSLDKYEKKVEECALLRAELKALKEAASHYAERGEECSSTTIPVNV